MTEKERLLEYIKNPVVTNARNIMGCSENWYNPYYVMKMTFKEEEIANMSEETIDICLKALDTMSESLY